jgi:glyoxylase-like metal-dependent hydrolase (beta-lactamase superfamily II)
MFETIRPNLFRIEIPLPGNPLKAVNSYIFKTPDRNLIIDTGMNRPECIDAMMAGLQSLNIDMTVTDIFITHMHADHSGLISHLATDTSKVYCSRLDADVINNKGDWHDMLDFAERSGFPSDEDAIRLHPGFKYRTDKLVDFTIVDEGDYISIGGYNFKCILTPGHTPGHLCLYEEEKKILISGDHILGRITPNISLWSDDHSPLNDYLKSLTRIYELDIDLILPGHRKIFTDCQARIDQLRQHHDNRAAAIVSILRQGPQNAFSIASQMKWDLSYTHWDQFPITQKWFATGEIVAHLKYLEDLGHVCQDQNQHEIKFSLI